MLTGNENHVGAYISDD